MFRDFLISFFHATLRWMGAILGIMLAIAIIGGFSQDSAISHVRVIAQPTHGFEVASWKGQDVILMIRIEGDIGSGSLTRPKIRELFQASQQGSLKGKVKAIFLEIDSRGGTVDDSEGIYDMIKQYSELYQTPVYALSDGYCASGGYMIACSAKKIYATPYSIIGSVGAIVNWFNISQVMEKVGVQSFNVACGEKKGMLSPYEKPKPEDSDLLKPIMNNAYERFLAMVSQSRPLLTEKVLRNETGARVYSAADAKALGFVDEVVTDRSLIIAALAKEAGLGSDYAMVEIQTSSGWSDFLETQASFKNVLNKIESSFSLTL